MSIPDQLNTDLNNYSYPNKFCSAGVGRAVRALAPKARAARPTMDVFIRILIWDKKLMKPMCLPYLQVDFVASMQFQFLKLVIGHFCKKVC